VGYKGRDLFESGVVYAPYMPVFTHNLETAIGALRVQSKWEWLPRKINDTWKILPGTRYVAQHYGSYLTKHSHGIKWVDDEWSTKNDWFQSKLDY